MFSFLNSIFMSDVIDIIHRLSYEVAGESNLKGVVDDLKQQANNIDLLKSKLIELNKAYATETNVKSQQNLSGQILITTDAITKQTAALQKQFAQSKPLQQAMTAELGIIQKLTDKINDLRHARERQTSTSGIKEVNAELAKAQAQLSALTNTQGTGFLATLFGAGASSGGSLGRQVLQGTLLGIGFGSGIGLISRVVSGLIEYGQTLLNTEKIEQQTAKTTQGLTDEIIKQADALEDYYKKVQDVAGVGLQAAQSDIDKQKAIGVIRGEIFSQNKSIFEKEQAQRDKERESLLRQQEINSGLGLAATGAGISGNFQKIFDNPAKFGVSTRVLDIISERLKQAEKDKISNSQLAAQLGKESVSKQEEIDLKLQKNAQDKLNASVEFQDKINEELYELDRKLKKDLAAEDEKFQQEKIKSQVTTASIITKSIEIETSFRLKQLEQERELERQRLAEKGQKLSKDVENDFSAKATAIRKEEQFKRIEQTRAYYQQQVKLYENLQVELAAARVGSGKQKLSSISALDENGNLSTQSDILDNELKLQLAANSAKYSDEVNTLEKLQSERRKRGEQQTAEYKETEQQLSSIYHEFAQNEEDFIRSSNIRKLNEYAEYYARFIQLVRSNESSYLQAIALRVAISGGDIRRDKGLNFLSKADQQRVNSLIGSNTGNQAIILSEQDALLKAQKRSDTADANRAGAEATGQPALITAAIKEQQAALDEIVRINEKIQKAENSTFDNSKEIRKLYVEQAIQDYQVIADTAVKAYQVISDARQRDLDREISVRTQRVDLAFKLAERGNTQALAQEQKALETAQQQKRQAALRDQEINAALTVSNALVAVAKAAAEGGVLAPATIALAIAAIGVGFAEANALSASQKQQFWKGGYTGEGGKYDEAGTVHKGEFVFDKEKTAKHREFFEAIHKGYDPFPIMALPKSVGSSPYADKKELREISDKMDMLIGKDVNVSQVVDKSGVHQIVVEQNKAHAVKWAS